jgi:hypothetical protein
VCGISRHKTREDFLLKPMESVAITGTAVLVKIKPHNLTHNTYYLTFNTIRVAQQY